MSDGEQGRSSFGRSLSARLRRKEQVARGEAVPEMPDEEAKAGEPQETDEDAALSDAELLAKYEVEDPDTIEDEARLDSLLEGKFPDRIRQMALRRMWRLNPMFRFADEMVEYGENYTDAATVIDGMTTAYQVGKGYLQKAFDAVEEAPDALPDGTVEAPADKPAGEEVADEEAAGEEAVDGRTVGDTARPEAPDEGEASIVAPDKPTAETLPARDMTDATAEAAAGVEVPPVRAQRMVFRRSDD